MNIIEKPIADLIAYENNPKIHTEKQIQQIINHPNLQKSELVKAQVD